MLSIDECWAYLESQLPDASKLPVGASPSAIQAAEATIGVQFPDDFRRFLLRHDGSGWHFIGLKIDKTGWRFITIEHIRSLWQQMVEIGATFERDEDDFGIQKGPIKHNHWNPRWIPFTSDDCGDTVFLDFDPADGGTIGQVADWWHECAESTLLASSLSAWLNEAVENIKRGICVFECAYE